MYYTGAQFLMKDRKTIRIIKKKEFPQILWKTYLLLPSEIFNPFQRFELLRFCFRWYLYTMFYVQSTQKMHDVAFVCNIIFSWCHVRYFKAVWKEWPYLTPLELYYDPLFALTLMQPSEFSRWVRKHEKGKGAVIKAGSKAHSILSEGP